MYAAEETDPGNSTHLYTAIVIFSYERTGLSNFYTCAFTYDYNGLVEGLETKWRVASQVLIGCIEFNLRLTMINNSFDKTPIVNAARTIIDMSLQKE